MGLLEWFKGSSRRGKVESITSGQKSPKDVQTQSRPSGQSPKREADTHLILLREELERERRKALEQERRLRDMETRFAEVQGRFVELMEKQTKTIELMLIKTAGSGKDSSRMGPDESPAEGSDEAEEMVLESMEKSLIDGEESQVREVLRDKTFSNFVVDESNRFAYLATEAVATGIGRKYNPLFIYGPPGVGKTHLLHALANKMIDNNPRIKILYSSTELFTDELIEALEKDDLQGFRRKYHDLDVLLIDDIQTLSGKENTQMEFFHLFNHLYNSQKQLVICSDRPPIEIKELESRLRSRFEGGLIIDINLPTFEGRRQILYNLSTRSGISLSNEVMDYMSYYLDSNIRELEGGFNRVTAYSTLMKEPITITLVRKVLEGVLLKKDTRMREGPERPVPDMKGRAVRSPDMDLEEETDQLERELLQELSKETHKVV